jgi:leucine dehydrogenase
MAEFEHENVIVHAGRRSGLPIVIAVHSTALGRAVGGCRVWAYDSWRDGLDDALRLSEAMTWKCALADLPFGGGKSVIPLTNGDTLSGDRRRAAMLDLGDVVDTLGGRYGVGEDVGTTAHDMWIARERTEWAYCLPPAHGGSGEPAEATAVGVLAAIRSTCRKRFGTERLTGLRFTIVGLGQVGSRLAVRLAAAGSQLLLTDIDPAKRSLANDLGGQWLAPDVAHLAETDVLVPAALGGLLSRQAVPDLSCSAVVGPANNQLAGWDVADVLAERDILWAPDFVVNAGGVVYGCLIDIQGVTPEAAMHQVELIGTRLERIFDESERSGVNAYEAAMRIARRRVADASRAMAAPA